MFNSSFLDHNSKTKQDFKIALNNVPRCRPDPTLVGTFCRFNFNALIVLSNCPLKLNYLSRLYKNTKRSNANETYR